MRVLLAMYYMVCIATLGLEALGLAFHATFLFGKR